MLHQYISI